MLSIFHYRRTFFAVMGANVRSLAFLRNLQTENPKERFVCIVPEQADSQEFAKLEQRRIKVVALDYNNPDSYANQATLKSLRLRNAKAIVSFEDEPESFGHAAVFNDWLEQLDLRPIPFYLLTADNRLKELISPQVMTWQRLNTQFFNLAELQAIELMSRETFSLYRTKVSPSRGPQPTLRRVMQSYNASDTLISCSLVLAKRARRSDRSIKHRDHQPRHATGSNDRRPQH